MLRNTVPFEERTRNSDHLRIKRQQSEKRARRRLRRQLWEADPHCCHCRRRLAEPTGVSPTLSPLMLQAKNTGLPEACLAIDRLSCPDCVGIVRAYALAESPDSAIQECAA